MIIPVNALYLVVWTHNSHGDLHYVGPFATYFQALMWQGRFLKAHPIGHTIQVCPIEPPSRLHQESQSAA